jgi:hypothetical protein
LSCAQQPRQPRFLLTRRAALLAPLQFVAELRASLAANKVRTPPGALARGSCARKRR